MERWTISKLEALALLGVPAFIIGGIAGLFILGVNALLGGLVAGCLSVFIAAVAGGAWSVYAAFMFFWTDVK